ncbi:TRAP transporter substrate-binding protein DctP [Ornithinimicrobium cavernae]|uniref:TRAP transporter substrate-binding protein DctP n=1 Tax=Ornithinimicrobium cavernae TaxID=2666047 RepID=UPI000D69FE0E|nr:TRAP transporter substrate-binding protein DctP [Ornithinimicrobium cavernae]
MRRNLAITSVTLVLALGLTACGGGVLDQEAAEGEEVTWRLATHQVPGTSRYESTLPLFAEEVSKATDGKFTIELYGGGTLFPISETYDSVSRGTVDAAAIFTGYWSSKDPVFNLVSLPGDPLTGPEEHFQRAEALDPIFGEVYAKSGIHHLGAFDYAPSEIFMSNRKIESLEDFKGMNIRATGVAGQFYDTLGASSVSIAGPELYSAMQLGTVDGAEFNDYLVNAEMGLNEVTDFVIEPALHTGPTSDKDLIINQEAWDALPESYQQAVIDARDKAREASSTAYAKDNEDAVQQWVDEGAEIIELPAAEVEEARQLAYEWLGGYADENEYTERYVTGYIQVLRDLGYDAEADAIESAKG